jgi:hypothetical protein
VQQVQQNVVWVDAGKETTSLVIIQFEPSADFQELLSGKMFYFFKL